MPSIDVKKRRIDSKVVYYGPGRSGKSENLRYIYRHLEPDHRGRLVSLPTKADPTTNIDVLPVHFGKVLGFHTTFHLCSGPGQAMALNTRKLLLRDSDGIVFVADTRPARCEANLDSLRELEENLEEYGLSLANIPHVFQYNRRSIIDSVATEELRSMLNLHGVPEFEADASTGEGVMEALRAIVHSVSEDLKRRL